MVFEHARKYTILPNKKVDFVHWLETSGIFPTYKNKKIGIISDLYIKKNFRNRRISSKLKDRFIEWFKEKGIRFIAAPLYPDNKFAHSLTKKWGFVDYKLEVRKKI